ncbi:MAG: hypothetical protein PHT49_12185 [Desulfovibrionales bacterium]|nr:hypothetical protein [Desulfovibrionales bacterium]
MHKDYNLPGFRKKSLLFEKVSYILEGLEETLRYGRLFGNAKKIYIYAGELYPPFYTDKSFLENFARSVRQGADVKVAFGPALYVETDGLLKLALKNDNVKLYRRKERDPAHFRLIEDADGAQFLFVDKPHEIASGKRQTALLVKGYDTEMKRFEGKFISEIDKAQLAEKESLLQALKEDRKEEDGKYRGFITLSEGEIGLATDEQIQELRITLADC